jgi:hypothetical protein
MNCPEVGDARQELAALTITLCARIGIALGLTNEVHDIAIGLDDCPVGSIATDRCFNLKPSWKFSEVANLGILVQLFGEFLFNS